MNRTEQPKSLPFSVTLSASAGDTTGLAARLHDAVVDAERRGLSVAAVRVEFMPGVELRPGAARWLKFCGRRLGLKASWPAVEPAAGILVAPEHTSVVRATGSGLGPRE